MNEQLIAGAIHFKRIGDLFEEHVKSHRRDFPSTSQWYRLKGYALTGDTKKAGDFLRERIQKKKVQKSWLFPIKGMAFHQWIETLFVKPVEEAADYKELENGKFRDLGFAADLPSRILTSDFATVKRAVFKKALCEFIDRVLLCQGEDGLTYRTDLDNGKMEVMRCG